MQIINRVRNTIRNFRMLERGDRVLVCVSGGPDSVFLLHALMYLKKELHVTIFIANLDHGIRGKESENDSLFVKKLSEDANIKLFFRKLYFKKTKGLSVEETARVERYDFFDNIAKKHNINKIATAHSADDVAETVLMRIIKGASLKGMAGIPPKRKSETSEYIRPLIELEKKEIIRFLKKNKIEYRVDKTNLENKFFRNTVRNKVIPYLSRFNPRIKRALVNLSESLREDLEFIEKEKAKAKGLARQEGKDTAIPLKMIVIQPAALQKEILRDALSLKGANIKKLSFRHWKEIQSLIMSKQAGKSIDLPGSIKLRKAKDTLYLSKL